MILSQGVPKLVKIFIHFLIVKIETVNWRAFQKVVGFKNYEKGKKIPHMENCIWGLY
jgi:hypothetical protein